MNWPTEERVMKLVTFSTSGEGDRVGVLTDAGVVDLSAAAKKSGAAQLPSTMNDFLAQGEAGLDRARKMVEFAGKEGLVLKESDVTLNAPIPAPPVLFMMGFNGSIIPTLKQKGWTVPDNYSKEPWWFIVPSAAVIGPNTPIVRPKGCEDLGNSPELGVVIGKPAWRVSPEKALDYVAGYTAVNDATQWDVQKRDHFMYTTTKVKSFPTCKPIGHCITTMDEIANPHDVKAQFWIDNKMVGECSTSKYRFSVAEVVSHASHYVCLQPGTTIAMGALPEILEMTVYPGQVVVNDFLGVARLSNPIVDESQITPAEYLRRVGIPEKQIAA